MPLQTFRLTTTVGVELEVNNIANASNDKEKVRTRFGRVAAGLDRWVVKGDASCGTGSSGGVELNSYILETTDDLRTVAKVCYEMRSLGFKVNTRCGLHVHLGVRHLTAEQRARLIRFFAQWENAFYVLDPERRSSHYCRPLLPDERNQLRTNPDWAVWSDRYRWMNGCAFRKYGTVEFRLMGGTLDELDVLGWVTFLLYAVDRVTNHGVDGRADLLPETGSNGRDLLERLFAALGNDGSKRCKLAFDWALKRYANAQQRTDLAAIREQRRQNRIAAWRGLAKFEPVFTPDAASQYASLDISAAYS